MEILPFPSFYKKSLINKRKNTTLRIQNELGKYKKGQVYTAASYAGNKWGVKVKIKEINNTEIKNLLKFGIPQQAIKTIIKKNVKTNGKVDIIRFEYV